MSNTRNCTENLLEQLTSTEDRRAANNAYDKILQYVQKAYKRSFVANNKILSYQDMDDPHSLLSELYLEKFSKQPDIKNPSAWIPTVAAHSLCDICRPKYTQRLTKSLISFDYPFGKKDKGKCHRNESRISFLDRLEGKTNKNTLISTVRLPDSRMEMLPGWEIKKDPEDKYLVSSFTDRLDPVDGYFEDYEEEEYHFSMPEPFEYPLIEEAETCLSRLSDNEQINMFVPYFRAALTHFKDIDQLIIVRSFLNLECQKKPADFIDEAQKYSKNTLTVNILYTRKNRCIKEFRSLLIGDRQKCR